MLSTGSPHRAVLAHCGAAIKSSQDGRICGGDSSSIREADAGGQQRQQLRRADHCFTQAPGRHPEDSVAHRKALHICDAQVHMLDTSVIYTAYVAQPWRML